MQEFWDVPFFEQIKWICKTLMFNKSSYSASDEINVLDCDHIPVCHSLYFLAW